jgi:hypothetical protein
MQHKQFDKKAQQLSKPEQSHNAHKKTEAMLNFYVLVIFCTLLGIALYSVNAIDLYVQSFR